MLLRAMPPLFMAGQQLPQRKVYKPNSPEFRDFMGKYAEHQLLKLFKRAAHHLPRLGGQM